MRDGAATSHTNLVTITNEPGPDERLFTPAFIALSLAELAYFTTAGLLIPITTLFAAGPLGANVVGVGLAVGAFSVTTVVLRPIAGREADRRGRRPLLIGGALLCAIVVALHVVTTDLAMLVGLRLLLGVAEAFFFVAGFAMVADLAPPHRAGEALSFNSLSLYLGIAFGPTIGFALLAIGGYQLAFLGGSVLAFAAAGLATRIPETVAPDQRNPAPTPLINRRALGPALALFCGIVGMAGFLAFVAIYAPTVGMTDAGPVLLLFGLIVVGCRLVFARAARPRAAIPPRRRRPGTERDGHDRGRSGAVRGRTRRRHLVARHRGGVHDAGDLHGHRGAGGAVGAGFGIRDDQPVPRSRVRWRTRRARPGCPDRRHPGRVPRRRRCRSRRGRGNGGGRIRYVTALDRRSRVSQATAGGRVLGT